MSTVVREQNAVNQTRTQPRLSKLESIRPLLSPPHQSYIKNYDLQPILYRYNRRSTEVGTEVLYNKCQEGEMIEKTK